MTDQMADTEKRAFVQNKTSQPIKTGFESVTYSENQVIFEEGETGDAVYLIISGQVEIRKGMKSSDPQTLAVLSKTDIFGEMALFDDSPRMAEAVARTNVELILIKRDEFNRRLDSVDPVIKAISVYLVERVRHMADEFLKRKDPHWGKWKKD